MAPTFFTCPSIGSFLHEPNGRRVIADFALTDVIDSFYRALDQSDDGLALSTGLALLEAFAEKKNWAAVVRLLTSGAITRIDEQTLDRLGRLAADEPRVIELLHLRFIAITAGATKPLCDYAGFLRKHKRHHEALSILTAAERHKPPDATIKYALGQCHLELRNRTRAAEFASQALQLDDSHAAAIELFLEATARFNPTRAFGLLHRLGVSIETTQPLYLRYLCIAHRAAGNYAEAFRCAQKFLKTNPQGPYAAAMRRHEVELRPLVDLYETLVSWQAAKPNAEQFARLKEGARAEEAPHRAIIGSFPALAEIDCGNDAELMELLAGCARDEKRDDAALSLCERAIAVHPRVPALAMAAEIYAGRLQFGPAIRHWRRCIEIAGNSVPPEVLLGLAKAYFASGDYPAALSYCEATMARTDKGKRGWAEKVQEVTSLMNGYLSVGALPVQLSPPGAAAPITRRRIFLTVIFKDEFDILDLHLAELGDKVDGIVLVESSKTFTGVDKPLHFQENASRYQRYLAKIKHVVTPPTFVRSAYTYVPESHQRNSALIGLSGYARDKDLVIVADCDEILNFDSIKDFAGDVACARLWQYHYFLNLKRIGGARPPMTYTPKSAVCTYEAFRNFTPHELRVAVGPARARLDGTWIDNGGWHFSYIGGEEAIYNKFQTYLHAELGAARHSRADWQAALGKLRAGESSGLIDARDWVAVSIDGSFPAALRNQQEKYAKYIIEPSAAGLSHALNRIQRKYERAIGIRK